MHLNPDIKISIAEGKFFKPEEKILEEIYDLSNVHLVSQTVEEVAIFDYKDNQHVGIVKGVDQHFTEVSGLNTVMYKGELDIENEDAFCSVGAGIATKLNISINSITNSLKVYMPKRNRKALDSEFKSRILFPSSIFSLRNEKDQEYVIAGLSFAQELIEIRDHISALEIKLIDVSEEKKTQEELKNIVGPKYNVLNRYEQDESFLKVMNIEKWSAFLILGFTLVLIIFNVIGSLWMIVIEKKRDISVLQALGFQSLSIKKIFYLEGILISLFGFTLGLISALALYYAQLHFGFIGVSNAFSKTAYPILMSGMDVAAVFVLVMVLGILASIPATRRAAKITAFIRSE